MQWWKKLKEEVVFKGDFQQVIKRNFELPNNKTGDFEIVSGSDHVTILALTKDRKVIITHEYGFGPEHMMPELPGGIIEANEDPKTAAARELLEETGYRGNLHFLAMSEVRYATRKQYHFAAIECEKVADQKLDANEFIEVELLSIDDFTKILRHGATSHISTGYLGLDFLKLLR